MKRKTAIRNILIISAGAVLLPGCKNSDRPKIFLKNISLSGSDEELLANMTRLIIPKTKDFIGAEDLKSHEFLLVMMDDCNGPENQKKFTDGMKSFKEGCKKKFDNSFIRCTDQQKKDFLKELDINKNQNDFAVEFYKTVKGYTVQSYTTSKEYMLQIEGYNMVPGSNYKGRVPVKKSRGFLKINF